MDAFLARSAEDRTETLLRAAGELGLAESAIEKDLWVCWALRELFQSPAGHHLTFKGGTSLSKGWGLIERFSEDIDLVVDRELLGFAGPNAPEAATSRNEQARRAKSVVTACQQFVRGRLLPHLQQSVDSKLAGHGVELEMAINDPDQQTILLRYTSVLPESGYLIPVVRMELGARSDTEPHQDPEIAPYLARVDGALAPGTAFRVRTVAPERTFWEKVCLLHEVAFQENGPKPRLARHYYDLWSLDSAGVAEDAMATRGLFQAVVGHRRLYFRGTAEGQRTLVLGKIRLNPTPDRLGGWRRDYDRMRDMFFNDPPPFDDVIRVAADLERRINTLDGTTAGA